MKQVVIAIMIFLIHITMCYGQSVVNLKHIVQRGETIEIMAETYGITTEMLKATNYDIDTFHTGMEVFIPVGHKYLKSRSEGQSEEILKDIATYMASCKEANRLYDAGDYKKASKLFATSIQNCKNYFPCEEAYFGKAMCDYKRGEWASAIDGFSQVVKIEDCAKEYHDISKKLMADAGKKRDAKRQRTGAIIGNIIRTTAEVGTAYMAASQAKQNMANYKAPSLSQGKSLGSMSDSEFKSYVNGNLQQLAIVSAMQTQQKMLQEEMQVKNGFISSYRKMNGKDPSPEEVQAAYNYHMQIKAEAYSTAQKASSGLYDKELGIGQGTSYSNSRSTTNQGCQSSTVSTYKRSCHLCRGSGKCITCNGRHSFLNPLTHKYITCPNCAKDGLCSACHGSGKKN